MLSGVITVTDPQKYIYMLKLCSLCIYLSNFCCCESSAFWTSTHHPAWHSKCWQTRYIFLLIYCIFDVVAFNIFILANIAPRRQRYRKTYWPVKTPFLLHFDFKVLLLWKWRTLFFRRPVTLTSQHGVNNTENHDRYFSYFIKFLICFPLTFLFW
jgi:hypothetical protein